MQVDSRFYQFQNTQCTSCIPEDKSQDSTDHTPVCEYQSHKLFHTRILCHLNTENLLFPFHRSF